VTRSYLDSGVLIAALRDGGELASRANALLEDPNRIFLSSVFLRLELLPKAAYFRNSAELRFYSDYFDRVAAWADDADAVVRLAEQEAARYGLNALDALHVAAAILRGADELVTIEGPRKPIHRAAGVRVVRP